MEVFIIRVKNVVGEKIFLPSKMSLSAIMETVIMWRKVVRK
ncbi:MAG: hypothetical protein V8R67_00205 [Eubacterium sp.]